MPPRKTVEPVNSEQLESQEREHEQVPASEDAEPTAPQAAPGPTVGEFEERAAEAEERAGAAEQRAQAAEAQIAAMGGELEEMKRTLNALMRQQRAASSDQRPAVQARGSFELADDAPAFLDFDRPYGTIVGDVELGYEQDGHQFGHDRKYVRSLPVKLRGCGRPFNPRLVGHVKPRPGLLRADGLDGIRDRE